MGFRTYRFAPDDAGKGASGTPEAPKVDEVKKDKIEAKELDKTITAVEKKIEKKQDELERASESTMHAVLEELRELRKELKESKQRRSFLMF